MKDLEYCTSLADIRQRKYEAAIHTLQEVGRSLAKSVNSETPNSKCTSNSGISRCSNASSLAKRKRAKAEAARASLEFAEKQAVLLKQEAELEEFAAHERARKIAEMEQEAARDAVRTARKKAELQTELGLLESRKQVATAEAGARVLEDNGSQDHYLVDLPYDSVDSQKRVQDFVDQQAMVVAKPDTNLRSHLEIQDGNDSIKPHADLPQDGQFTHVWERNGYLADNNPNLQYQDRTPNFPSADYRLSSVMPTPTQIGNDPQTIRTVVSEQNRNAPAVFPSSREPQQ